MFVCVCYSILLDGGVSERERRSYDKEKVASDRAHAHHPVRERTHTYIQERARACSTHTQLIKEERAVTRCRAPPPPPLPSSPLLLLLLLLLHSAVIYLHTTVFGVDLCSRRSRPFSVLQEPSREPSCARASECVKERERARRHVVGPKYINKARSRSCVVITLNYD